MPTGEVLNRRNMADEDTCCLCGARDTWRHALLTCAMSRSVWALAPEELVEKLVEHQEEDPKEWLFALYKILDGDDFTRLVVTAWAIWGARRKAIHEDIFQSPHGPCDPWIHQKLFGRVGNYQQKRSKTGGPAYPKTI